MIRAPFDFVDKMVMLLVEVVLIHFQCKKDIVLCDLFIRIRMCDLFFVA